MKKLFTIFAFITILLLSCQKANTIASIEGLWLVEKVEMGSNQMTPVARWMRFNTDGTQTSGNGWLQHSVGSWELKKDKLSIVNSNGISDAYDPFQYSLEEKKMTWKRNEEGDTVIVFLKKIEKLPISEGNQLMGLWELKEFIENDVDKTNTINAPEKAMIHFRWDNTYVQYNMPIDKKYGVYKVHGHKPEIQMINYGKGNSFDFWKFKISEAFLTMTSTDNTTKIVFKRSHQFPQ
ncbi:MAG: hypothetical protein JXQ93_09335 [Flavobacteriaceae bacterium]